MAKISRTTLFLFGLAFVVGFLVLYAKYSPYWLPTAVARQRLKSGQFDVVLDVRTDAERKTLGHLKGSVHIPMLDLTQDVRERIPNQKARILVYCNTGQRSRLATDVLRSLGYRNAFYTSASYTELV